MTQAQLEREVAVATGEELNEIRRLGFSLADDLEPAFDPEPPTLPHVIDWDEHYGVEPLRYRPIRRRAT